MKTLLKVLVIAMAILVSLNSRAQNILIADNNVSAVPVTGKVFTGATALQDAIAAAVDDDIIQVIRSAVNYGTITIDKRLNIFGIGLNPDTEGGSLSPVTQIDITEPTATGTRISGLSIGTGIFLGGGVAGALNNILIENSWVRRLQHVVNTTTLTNLVIRNCIMGYNVGATTEETIDLLNGFVANVVIANNVIYGSTDNFNGIGREGGITTSLSTIENNLFVHRRVTTFQWFAFEELRNCTVKNNIFYRYSPRIPSGGALSGNTFENNIAYDTNVSSDTFSTDSGNTSVGNHEAVNPVLANVPNEDNTGSITTFDPTVSGTEAVNGGTDGNDIGVFGGPIPFSKEGTLIPTIQVLDVPSMVIEGNTLNVHIEAKGN